MIQYDLMVTWMPEAAASFARYVRDDVVSAASKRGAVMDDVRQVLRAAWREILLNEQEETANAITGNTSADWLTPLESAVRTADEWIMGYDEPRELVRDVS